MEKVRFLNYISSINPEDRQKTERILKKIISKYMSDPRKPYLKRYELELFNSKDIEKLLTLLENSMSNIRKLTLLVIGLVLMNPLSKIFFLEKCGLSLVVGRCFLTRLKYVYNFSSNQRNATKNVLKIMKILKVSGKGPQGTMFWYISLDLERNRMPEDFHPQVHEFRVRDMFDDEGNLDLSLVPDPVYHLCGLEFYESDKKMKIDYQRRLQKGEIAEDNRMGRTYAQSTITSNSKAGRPSHGIVNSGNMGRSGVYKGRPLTGQRLKVMRGSAKAELEGYKGKKNPSLYFRSSINQGTGIKKKTNSKFDSLNNISGTMTKTLKMQGNFKQVFQSKLKAQYGKLQNSSKTPRTLGNKLKMKLQNSLITNSKRNKNKPQKSRLSTNMAPFQFGTNSSHLQDRRNTFNYSMGLQSSVHDSNTKMGDLRAKLGIKGGYGSRGSRIRSGKFESNGGRFAKGFKTGHHN
jgi:hypothetical protein